MATQYEDGQIIVPDEEGEIRPSAAVLLLFRVLSVIQLLLGGGILACAVIATIDSDDDVVFGISMWIWGPYSAGGLMVVGGIFGLVITCRGNCDSATYNRHSSCLMRTRNGITMFIMMTCLMSSIFVGVSDSKKNALYMTNLVLTVSSVIFCVTSICFDCVHGKKFGMKYHIHSEGGTTHITTVSHDPVEERHEQQDENLVRDNVRLNNDILRAQLEDRGRQPSTQQNGPRLPPGRYVVRNGQPVQLGQGQTVGTVDQNSVQQQPAPQNLHQHRQHEDINHIQRHNRQQYANQPHTNNQLLVDRANRADRSIRQTGNPRPRPRFDQTPRRLSTYGLPDPASGHQVLDPRNLLAPPQSRYGSSSGKRDNASIMEDPNNYDFLDIESQGSAICLEDFEFINPFENTDSVQENPDHEHHDNDREREIARKGQLIINEETTTRFTIENTVSKALANSEQLIDRNNATCKMATGPRTNKDCGKHNNGSVSIVEQDMVNCQISKEQKTRFEKESQSKQPMQTEKRRRHRYDDPNRQLRNKNRDQHSEDKSVTARPQDTGLLLGQSKQTKNDAKSGLPGNNKSGSEPLVKTAKTSADYSDTGSVCSSTTDQNCHTSVSQWLRDISYTSPPTTNPLPVKTKRRSKTQEPLLTADVRRKRDMSRTSGPSSRSDSSEPLPMQTDHFGDRQIPFPTIRLEDTEAFRSILEEVNRSIETMVNIVATLPVQDIEVSRARIVDYVMAIYSDPSILQTQLHVTFLGELGSDMGVLTKDMFSTFWKKAYKLYFKGEDTMVPHVDMHESAEENTKMVILGRVLVHTMMLTGSVPVNISRTTMLQFANISATPSDALLLEDFMLYVGKQTRTLLHKAIGNPSSLADNEITQVIDIFSKFDMKQLPNTADGNALRCQILCIARTHLLKYPYSLIVSLSAGKLATLTQEFWDQLDEYRVRALYFRQSVTAVDVISCLRVSEAMQPEWEPVLHFLKQFLGQIDHLSLKHFVYFVTGAHHIPDEGITLMFGPALYCPIAHTCGNVLELPTKYENYQQFRDELQSVIQSEDSLPMTVVKQ